MGSTAILGQGIPSVSVTACSGLDMSSLDFTASPEQGIPSHKSYPMDFTAILGQGIPFARIFSDGLHCRPRAGNPHQQWSKFISAYTR